MLKNFALDLSHFRVLVEMCKLGAKSDLTPCVGSGERKISLLGPVCSKEIFGGCLFFCTDKKAESDYAHSLVLHIN